MHSVGTWSDHLQSNSILSRRLCLRLCLLLSGRCCGTMQIHHVTTQTANDHSNVLRHNAIIWIAAALITLSWLVVFQQHSIEKGDENVLVLERRFRQELKNEDANRAQQMARQLTAVSWSLLPNKLNRLDSSAHFVTRKFQLSTNFPIWVLKFLSCLSSHR